MALNYSCSVFPHWSCLDDDFGSTRQGSRNVADLLPADPFGMGLGSTFTSTLASLIGDRVSYSNGYQLEEDYLMWGSDDFGCSSSTRLVSGINSVLDSGCDSESEAFSAQACVHESENLRFVGDDEACDSGEEIGLHSGFLFALSYLDTKDLLSVERVCKTLRSAVEDDDFLWRSICIEPPSSLLISDEDLGRLTQRARGRLSSLGLFGCSRITDEGLKCVLESNPKLKKLSIPGCRRLNLEILIHNLKTLKCSGAFAITHLRLGRTFSVTQENYRDLKFILGVDELHHSKACSPRFFHSSFSSLYCDDDCAIDIEMCPKCERLKIVYDCTAEECHREGAEECRACDVCIARCVQCGRCIKNCEYEETFCLENLCSGCWKKPTKCPDVFG